MGIFYVVIWRNFRKYRFWRKYWLCRIFNRTPTSITPSGGILHMTVFYSSRPLHEYKTLRYLTIASVSIERQYLKQLQKQLHAQIISDMFKNILPYQILKPAMQTCSSERTGCFLRMGNTSYLGNVTLNKMVKWQSYRIISNFKVWLLQYQMIDKIWMDWWLF